MLFRPRFTWRLIVLPLLVLTVMVTLGTLFYLRGQTIMQEELKERLRTTAAVAALSIDPELVESMEGSASLETPGYRTLVNQLHDIRENVPNARFLYIMERTEEPSTLAFIADADALAPLEEVDENGNGVVDEDEEPSYPGDEYDITEVPALQGAAFQEPTTDEELTSDQWGRLMSGYAPIRNSAGDPIAVLGIDMEADDYVALSQRIFSPVALLLVILAGVLMAAVILSSVRARRIETLKQISAERSGLLKIAFHQLGTPLTILHWTLDAMKEEPPKSRAALEEHIQHLDEGVSRIGSIFNMLETADHVQAGAIQYTPQDSSLDAVLKDVLVAVEARLSHRKQKLIIEGDTDAPLKLDPLLIGGVLRELVDNAIDFSPDSALITIRARKRLGSVEVQVIDRGCGISKEDQARLFQEFMRGKNAHRHKPNGNGLGLFIAKGIIEKAGGDLWVKTSEGKGSTFTFTLPLR
jgi:signal transduction histidine kinase